MRPTLNKSICATATAESSRQCRPGASLEQRNAASHTRPGDMQRAMFLGALGVARSAK
jgi:hypothetical protein